MNCNNSKIGFIDFNSLVDKYINTYRKCNEPRTKDFNKIKNLDEVIHNTALALDFNGNRLEHHRRRQKDVLELSEKILLNNKGKIASCKDFHTLRYLIQHLLSDVKWLGELYWYDTAFEIGLYLNLFPEYIYLHCGTRDGARNLGLNYRKEYLTKDELPKELSALEPYELENFLCIYKDDFRKIITNAPTNGQYFK